MSRPRRIVLGISGGIAAYKSAELARELVRAGAELHVAMTRGARAFVSPLTFAVLSGREVHTEVWGDGAAPAVDHVALADWADLLLVAPATAHTLAKFANGLADDFLSTFYLAHRGPVLLAPAMESAMWSNPAVRRNVETLVARGVRLVGPESGPLASGNEGVGRMAEPATIAAQALRLAEGRRDMEGLRLIVTAGPTRERLDPIRFVSNRSSGRMGFALAEAARDRGARVTLIAGPTELPAPDGVRTLSIESADDLVAVLVREFPETDGLVMAAAVADFVPEASARRLHREEGEVAVRLRPGRDVLAGLRPLKRGQTVVAFAAETEDFEARGRRKMEAKGADLVVVNDVGRPGVGFESADNEVLLISRNGESERVARAPKRDVADRIWDAFLRVRAAAPSSAAAERSPST